VANALPETSVAFVSPHRKNDIDHFIKNIFVDALQISTALWAGKCHTVF
jgi:hypothetical protein